METAGSPSSPMPSPSPLRHIRARATRGQSIGYVMPALLHIQTNRGELRRCMAAWREGEPEYKSSLSSRFWAMRSFALPFFMVVFGVVAMVAGVATAVVADLTPTKA